MGFRRSGKHRRCLPCWHSGEAHIGDAMGCSREWELHRDGEVVAVGSESVVGREEDREEEGESTAPPAFVSRRCRSFLCLLYVGSSVGRSRET